MTSPSRRDEVAANSPLRNAFASSSSLGKPIHSPFTRRTVTGSTRFSQRSEAPRPPDAISTSSSTLVNADSTGGYRPWEVRSESSSSEVDSLASGEGGRRTPTLQTLDEIGTLPSIHITPLVRRGKGRNRLSNGTNRSGESSGRRARQLCPDDCRCSDQDIDLGLCRRVVGSSSSGSDSGSLSVGVHPMRRRPSDSIPTPASGVNDATGTPFADQSSHSQSEPRSQSRDFEKDPILVPRSTRRRSPNSIQRSFDQLQRGLDTLDESDAESDTEALAAQRRAESMARWTARRSTLSQSHARQPDTSAFKSSPRSLASETPSKLDDAPLTPLKATPGRRSIAAVFESLQKEREARAAEEQRQWQEKQARRDRERAARAFDAPLRRRGSASSSQVDSPVSFATPQSAGGSTVYQSMTRATPSRSTGSGSPLISSMGSPKAIESAVDDVRPQNGEDAAGGLPDMPEADEVSADDNPSIPPPQEQPLTTPTHPPAFAFSPQPMALVEPTSPPRTTSVSSTPSSSPRKNAHKRQTTNVVSLTRTPALNRVFTQDTDPQTPVNGILSSTKKASARRGHSVRFSPRPDYRSDSGSWDESGVQSRDEEGLLPAKEIVIPEILATASMATPDAEEAEGGSSGTSSVDEQTSPVSVVGKPHTRPCPVRSETHHSATSAPAPTTSSPQSIRLPGAYTATPPRYSRHVIRPSPNLTRVLPPHLSNIEQGSVRGLFADHAVEIPRESTPPPKMLPPDDPSNSPRSPRPVDLGNRFPPLESEEEGEVEGTIARILETVEVSDRVRRRQLGEGLKQVSDQLGRLEAPVTVSAFSRRRVDDAEGEGEAETERMEELKRDVMQALTVLADRLQLPPTPAKEARRGLSRRTTLALVVVQCVLLAYLLNLAEQKAAHLRMYSPPDLHLVLFQAEAIDWSPSPRHYSQPPLGILMGTRYPPLPHPWWTGASGYVAVNGTTAWIVQLAVYGLSQVVMGAMMVVLAPVQVVWLLIHQQ